MAAPRLDELLARWTGSGGRDGGAAAQALALIRESNLHRPAATQALSASALSYLATRSVEYWTIVEQTCRALADHGPLSELETVARSLCDRFQGARASLSAVLCDEADGKWDPALNKYMRISAQDPLCRDAYKRQVAILKSTRRGAEAIALLNHYVRNFGTDLQAWAELAYLCLQHNRFAHAVFAASEVVLLDPNNHASHTLVADCYMAVGAPSQTVALARRHYAASVATRRDNLRALYGMWLAAAAIRRDNALPKEEMQHNAATLAWATSAIKDVYRGLRGASQYAFIEEVLDDAL